MQLIKKTVLVTGATGGIGGALCALLAAEGCTVVFNGLRDAELRALQAQLGMQHHSVRADISSPEGRDVLVSRCAAIGGVDVLVNVAGILDCQMFSVQDELIIERIMQVNALAPMLLTRQLLPQLLCRPQALIMNVGSVFGSIGHPGFVAYCTSKAALKMFSEALSRELADTVVKVCHVAPRATHTPLNPASVQHLNDVMGNHTDTPEEVAQAILRQMQQGERQQYLGWPEKLFVRVNTLLPNVVDVALARKLPLIKQTLEQPGRLS